MDKRSDFVLDERFIRYVPKTMTQLFQKDNRNKQGLKMENAPAVDGDDDHTMVKSQIGIIYESERKRTIRSQIDRNGNRGENNVFSLNGLFKERKRKVESIDLIFGQSNSGSEEHATLNDGMRLFVNNGLDVAF